MHARPFAASSLVLFALLSACATTTTPAPVPAVTRATVSVSAAGQAPVGAGEATPTPGSADPSVAPTRRDAHEQLQLTLWMQTAAEYQMITRATYAAAARTLDAALADFEWTAAVEQAGDVALLPPAIILDLDETVMDNSRFEAELALRRATFDQKLWAEWVALEKATLVPGAAELIAAARRRGIAVFFVTNRDLAEEPATIRNLAALGVEATPESILAQHENGWDSSDKTARRETIAGTHRILMLFGDDLGDFIPSKLAPAERVAAAERYRDWWGERWYVLPNPSYGSWERALWNHQGGLSDAQQLERKYEALRGFAD